MTCPLPESKYLQTLTSVNIILSLTSSQFKEQKNEIEANLFIKLRIFQVYWTTPIKDISLIKKTWQKGESFFLRRNDFTQLKFLGVFPQGKSQEIKKALKRRPVSSILQDLSYVTAFF